ncbi:hypothetical protein K491DRAFT_781044 [Lophiostoma macrostomum CBS 122681]|uniref:Ima1 N-terminal domain-containing protein n=1 Tax=Lophiostoma macrostomum CBS 122681 TaxID=1314788 RepID=A0A6A6SXL3_9PLEO|nr:hypothetical protein K491DRAFT_781044 [Lophiostoma macrostomum CBS 122681]
MPQLLRRRLRCFYCGDYSRNEQPGIPRTWFCAHCEAMNHLDERGEITDPPAQADSPAHRVQYASARAPFAMAPPAAPAFQLCDVCLRNQEIVRNKMALYIPDPSDPDYKEYEANAEDHKLEMQTRYPPVCDNCQPGLDQAIRQADYSARTANLLRVLEDSKKVKQRLMSRELMRELQWIDVGKWLYFASLLVGVTWHFLGAFAWRTSSEPRPSLALMSPDCARKLWKEQCWDLTCFNNPPVIVLVGLSLLADFVSIFAWHRELKQMRMRPGGKLSWETLRWQSRLVLVAVRGYVFWYHQDPPAGFPIRQDFHYWHIAMTISILVVLLINLLVKLEYPGMIGSTRQHDSGIHGTSTRTSTRPGPATSFDSMSQTLGPLLKEPGDSRRILNGDSPPPSPSESSASDSDIYTPRANRHVNDDAMDWTPTGRFAKQAVPVERPLFGRRPSKSSTPTPVKNRPTPTQRLQPEANPFRTKVPPKPQHPSHKKANAFQPPIFLQALPEVQSNFLKNFIWANERPGSGQRPAGAGRSTVRRDEEFFREPQLIHDWQGYVPQKRTGVEYRFGDSLRISDERRAPYLFDDST